MIEVSINGEKRTVAEGSVTALLEQLGLHPRLIVVEYNREILDRGVFDATEVRAGDQFELVHFVGGG
ncbi:MAG TPA: sulfur carrier protein ThiS [Longimicrobiales bacterium]